MPRELNLIYKAKMEEGMMARLLRRAPVEQEIKNDLIIYEDHIFSVLSPVPLSGDGMTNGVEVKVVQAVREPIPHIRVTELQRVPSGFLSRRTFEFYPLQAEELKKLLHPLCFLKNPAEINVTHDVVTARDQLASFDQRVIRVGEIRVEHNELVLRRSMPQREVLYEFVLEERDGVHIVRKFSREGVWFKLAEG